MTFITITEESLRALVRSLLTGHGADPSEAAVVADAMVWSDVMGRPNQGAWRLPTLIARLTQGHIKSPCRARFQRIGAAAGIVDGGNGSGHFVGHRAMLEAIALAQECGVGLVGVRNSNLFGAGAYYVQLAAEADMISFALSNSPPHVAAFGGRKAVLGTNPFAFGAPRRNGRSVLVDMSTAASAGSTILKMLEGDRSQLLPEGMAIDQEGQPTRDPRQIGSLLPLAGAKGFGLGLLVEILCGVLTGAGISHEVKKFAQETGHNGHFFLAIDVGKFMPLATYYDRMETLVGYLMASSGAPGEEATVQLPGEHRWQARDKSLRDGITLDAPTVAALTQLAERAAVTVPW